MPKAMHRVDCCEAFGRKSQTEIFLTEVIDSVSGKFLAPLIDKQPVAIERFRIWAVVSDVVFDEFGGLWPQGYLPVVVCLTQDSQGFVVRIKVVEIQGC